MIFSHLRTIIFINKEKIRWIKSLVPSGKFLGSVQELPWSEENLQLAITKISERFPKIVRISVGEDFAYVTQFKKEKNRPIDDEAQAFVPEKLETGWDTKEGGSGKVQLMAIQREFFEKLKKMLIESGLEPEVVEAESISMSRLIPKEKNKTLLFAKYDDENVLGAVENGLVLATRVSANLLTKEKIEEFLDYIGKQKGVADAVFVHDETGELAKTFGELGLVVHEKSLDPMMGVAMKKDLKGRDKDVLNISVNQETNKSTVSFGKIFAKIAIVATIAGAIALGIYFFKKSPIELFQAKKTQPDAPGLIWSK